MPLTMLDIIEGQLAPKTRRLEREDTESRDTAPRETEPQETPLQEETPADLADPVITLPATGEIATLTVVELLLKDETTLNRLLESEDRQRELLPKFMAVAVVCFAAHGVVTTCVLPQFAHAGHWSIGNLTIAYTLGMIAANGICLPSFYFYGLLAGLRTTMLAIAAQAIKGMATGGLALVGLLPIYLALALAAMVPLTRGSIGYGAETFIGLLLPFVAGLRGAVSLYRGLGGLAATMRPARRAQRECLLRRMILAWVGCFTFVTPVVIYSLWSLLSRWTDGIGY